MTTLRAIVMTVALALSLISSRAEPQAQREGWSETIEAQPDPAIISDAAIRERIIATGLPWRVRDRASGIELLLVPPGGFTTRENAVVTIAAPFYLGRTEVTQAQWMKLMQTNPSKFQPSGFQATADESRDVKIRRIMSGGYTRQEAAAQVAAEQLEFSNTSEWPVDSISPQAVEAFLAKTGLSLPTESQWEYACRGATPSERYGELEQIAWMGANADEHPHSVATKRANAFGLHDMLGNLWEWCSGPYEASTPTSSSDEMHPLRGGNWLSLPQTCTATARTGSDAARSGYGLRVMHNP